MKLKPKFEKNKAGLYLNTNPKKINYKGAISRRNKSDLSFYTKRFKILQKEFDNILSPIMTKLSRRLGPNLKTIDIGCGDGLNLEVLHKLDRNNNYKLELYGIDIDPVALKAVKPKAILKKTSCTKLPFPNDYFDFAISTHVIEHLNLKDIETSISEMYRVLKPGGVLFCETPNPESMLSKTMGENWWMYIDEHLVLIPPRNLRAFLNKASFSNVNAKTRVEVDEQIDEIREILHGQKNPAISVINKVFKRFRHRLMKYYLLTTKQGSVTVAIAQK